ncbi:hypothetical protein [Nonomuraea sp. SBT364]|uniref:hypothetical protein n=1 Tax=Nonomuraea sp. SBT364 TaxID=1580530 RepID=UPI00066EEF72|nr:hypothetical protein [Nonomuraea sp. SBT364]
MRKIAVGIISALAGGTMLMSGGAANAATKASEVEILDISPNPVVVRGDSETNVKFKVGASSDVERVELSVEPDGRHARTLVARDVRELEKWLFNVPFNKNDQEGKWKATAVAFDDDGDKVASDTIRFYVDVRKGKSDTRITRFSADPTYKVRKGRTIRFSGRLQAEDRGWEPLRNQKVHIYYRASGSSGWKWVDSDRTNWRGDFYASTRAYKSGTFKAVYKGSWKLDDSESRQDYVRVYGGWHR